MTDSVRRYAQRDIFAQDKAGGYYGRHVSALTAEKLHAKSDIAAELAHRDMEIDQLVSRLAASEAEVARAHAAETLADERWMRDGELRDAAEAERDSLRDKLAKLAALVNQHCDACVVCKGVRYVGGYISIEDGITVDERVIDRVTGPDGLLRLGSDS